MGVTCGDDDDEYVFPGMKRKLNVVCDFINQRGDI